MIIYTKYLETQVALSEEYVTSIHIANKHLFSNIANQCFDITNGEKSSMYIMENDNEINAEKVSIFVSSPYNFDYNNKKIQNAIVSFVDGNINFDALAKGQLENSYINFCSEFIKLSEINDIGLSFTNEMEIKKVIKFFDVTLPKVNNLTQITDMLQFIEIIAELKATKLIIFLSIKSYFNDEELEKMFKMAVYCKLNVLIVEHSDSDNALKNERVVLVDEDYDEIIIDYLKNEK